MKNLFSFLFFIFTFFSQNFAQSDSISGKVAEQSTKELMQFVNVALHRSGDSTLFASAVTDKDGGFLFTAVPEGNYYIEITFIGFETFILSPVTVKPNVSKLKLGLILITTSKNILGEVEINGEKPLMENSIDRKVYNVEKDVMSTSGSASDILTNVPSVTVDADGNVSLRGSGNVTILINGKPSPMMKVNSANALQQIPANTIERIEIITNPSAKYKPDGSAGIINIVLKKEKKIGFNGLLVANVSDHDRYNSTLSMNYKPGKINLFMSYGFRQDDRYRTSSDVRDIFDSLGNYSSHYANARNGHSRPLSHTLDLGMDYSLNEKNDLGISGNYFYEGFLRTDNTRTTLSDSIGQITSDYNRRRVDNEYEWDKELSASWEHRFKKEDHAISFEAEFTDHYEVENNKYTQSYFSPYAPATFDNTVIEQFEKQGAFTAEYTLPINEESELEAGYAWEYLAQDFDFFGEYFDVQSDSWVKDLQKSNRFLFTQNVHALYATYSRDIEDFSFMLGLRAEQANITTNAIDLDSIIHNYYFKLYPTLHLSYELDDDQQLQLSYSKRVNRPEGDDLNPFPEYRDPRVLRAGNPYLRPEQIHAVEFSYELKKDNFSFLPGIYYKYFYDSFTEISRYINDSTLLSTNENLGHSQNAGLEFIFTWKYKKILTLNCSADGFYNVIDASNLGYSETRSALSGNSKIAVNVNITPTTMLQLNCNLHTSELTPQGKELAGFVLNAGMRQDLFKKRASLLLTVSDVFNTMRWEGVIDTPQLYQKTINRRVSRVIYIGFSWHFGRSDKRTGDDLHFDEKM